MRVPDPPKDSFYYIMQTAGETSAMLYNQIRTMQKSRDSNAEMVNYYQEMSEAYDRSGYLSKSEAVAMFSWFGSVDYYLRKAPTDIVISKDLCTQMFLSGIEDVPYGSIEVNQAFQFVNIQNADLHMTIPIVGSKFPEKLFYVEGKPYGKYLILGFMLIDLERMGSPLFDIVKRRASEFYRQNKETTGIEPIRYVLMSVLDGAPDPYGPFVAFGERMLSNSDAIRHEVASYMLGLKEDDTFGVAASEISEFGIALDITLKSLLYTQMGEFDSAALSYGSLPQTAVSRKKPTKKKGPPKRKEGDYMVSYISDKSGRTLPWLPSEEAAELADELIDDSNDQQIIRTARGEIRIPNHAKLIWVTEEYIQRHSIPEDEIYDEGMIGRKRYGASDPSDMDIKYRYLIKKMFTYEKVDTGEGEESSVKARVKRVSSSRKNPFFY